MKKVLFIFCILFSFSTIFAEDISTLEIEGISIGDNTLDFINEEELLKWVERTKDHYSYLLEPNKYAEVYYYKDLKIYDFLSFMIENYSQSQFITKRSEKYTIKSISGSIDFSDNLKGCLNKRSEIEKDIDKCYYKNFLQILNKFYLFKICKKILYFKLLINFNLIMLFKIALV